MKFKINEVVRLKTPVKIVHLWDDNEMIPENSIGKVLRYTDDSGEVAGVEFEKRISKNDNYNCNGSGKPGHCKYIFLENLELVNTSDEKFEVGDYVETLNITSDEVPKGTVGKVIHIISSLKVGIEFEYVNSSFHNCSGKGKSSQCLYIYISKLKLFMKEPSKIRKLKVSDRVKTKKSIDKGAVPKNICGTVIRNPSLYRVSVEFDISSVDFHNCQGIGKNNHCYNVPIDDLEFIEPIEREKNVSKNTTRDIITFETPNDTKEKQEYLTSQIIVRLRSLPKDECPMLACIKLI